MIEAQTENHLARRLTERREFIRFVCDSAQDSRYKFYELRGPSREVELSKAELFLNYPPEEFQTTVTNSAASDDGMYQIVTVRRERIAT